MKKIDYQHLAETIKANLQKAENAKKACPPEFLAGWIDATTEIAVIFSDHAHVDNEKFLAACGISTK